MIFKAVQGVGNRAPAGVAHGADQAHLFWSVPLVDIEQVDALQTDLRRIGT